jgi:flavin-binding protein dodecin
LRRARRLWYKHLPRSSNAGDCRQEVSMAVARVTEIRASSPDGFQEAVLEGLKRAVKTVRGITGLEVLGKRVKVERGQIVEYRVDMKIIFILE